ncbi:hypothetical protein BDP27DRAFT_1444112, partial [Rhodocollybia butyracea]
MNSSSLSLEQLAAIAALPDDQRIALAQEQNFAAVPAYLQHSSDPASRQSMTNNEAPGCPCVHSLCVFLPLVPAQKIVAKSRVRKRSHRDDSNIFSEMQTSMAQSMKLHEWIVDNIEESNCKTEVFQDKFLNIFARMVDK